MFASSTGRAGRSLRRRLPKSSINLARARVPIPNTNHGVAASGASSATVPDSKPAAMLPGGLTPVSTVGRAKAVEDVNELDQLFQEVYPLIRGYKIREAFPDETPVVQYETPTELSRILGVTDGAPRTGQPISRIIHLIELALQHSVRTGHPRYFDKLCAGSGPVGQVAELITAVLNTNVHTYAVAPVFAVLERAVIKAMAKQIGFSEETADGLLVPGGTFANIIALYAARHAAFPHVKVSGWQPGDDAVCFTSVQAHYSIKRAAMMAGIGMNGALAVPASRDGVMDVAALDEMIHESRQLGKTPFFVSATAGTTVMGGYDPLLKIREVIDRHNAEIGQRKIWMHVDGAWGGSVAMSEKLRHLIDGAELADSMSWNFQKGLGVPVYSAAVVTNNRQRALEQANQSCAEYLFHEHEASDYDLGDKSLQCGRRPDALKIWLEWERQGTDGFAHRVETAHENAQYLASEIKRRGLSRGFVLVAEPMYNNVCWWYVPQNLRESANKNIGSIYPQLDKVTPEIYARMQRAGTMLVNFNPLSDHNLPRFFRIILNQPQATFEDMDFVLDEMERLGADIVA